MPSETGLLWRSIGPLWPGEKRRLHSLCTVLEGMAKAIPIGAPDVGSVEIELLTPMTSPSQLNVGPPELPL